MDKEKNYRFYATVISKCEWNHNKDSYDNIFNTTLINGDFDVLKTTYYRRPIKFEPAYALFDGLYIKKEIRETRQNSFNSQVNEESIGRQLHYLARISFKELTNIAKIVDFKIVEEPRQTEEEHQRIIKKGWDMESVTRTVNFESIYTDESAQDFDKWYAVNPEKAKEIEEYIRESEELPDEIRLNDTYTLDRGIVSGLRSRALNGEILTSEEYMALFNKKTKR